MCPKRWREWAGATSQVVGAQGDWKTFKLADFQKKKTKTARLLGRIGV